jgi:acyl-CoA synthetase (AMP-forming)/AMP-acid ligase II
VASVGKIGIAQESKRLPGQVWDAACEMYADDVALVSEGDNRFTYGDWSRSARTLADLLLAQGVRPGERVALGFVSGPPMVQAYLCGALSGIVLVPLSHRATAPEIRQQLDETNAVAVLYGSELADTLQAAGIHDSGLKVVLRHDDPDAFIPTDGVGSTNGNSGGGLASVAPLDPLDPFCIMYTGGTTGVPKGAMQTHLSWYHCLEAVVEQWELTEDDVHLQTLPMCHVSWFTTAAMLAAGGRTATMSRWDAHRAIEVIERERVTVLNMPPTMVVDIMDILDKEERDLSSVRFLSIPGVVPPPETYERARARFGDILASVYGMTETSGPVTFVLPGELVGRRSVSAGRPSPYVEVTILDPEPTEFAGRSGLPLESGEVGLGGPHIVTEHANGNAAMSEGESFLRTGDIGAIDEDGFLFILGRKKDMVKSGGYNVYPREVEDVLRSHPDIAEAAVVGRPDPRWVEAVHAAVVPQPGAEPDVEELRAHCREQLSGFKMLKTILVLDALPYTKSFGKVDKKAVATYIDEAGGATA